MTREEAEKIVLAVRGSYDAPGFEACVNAVLKGNVMETKYTQGPWKVRRNQSNDKPACQVTTKDKEVICSMAKGDFGLNDARLIAAAPDLLDAAILARHLCEEMNATKTNAYAAVCAAISKTNGEGVF
jgi:hypothetical protein